MSDLSLIPFALKLPDRTLVDVSEVDRGRGCQCVCPSCETPLIAKKGDVKEWHFAHDSKVDSPSTKKECEYSFWVSVVRMAKVLIRQTETLTLPAHKMYSNEGKEFTVSKKTRIEVDSAKIVQRVGNLSVDAIVVSHGHSIAISFTAPHRKNNQKIETDNKEISSVLEISLNAAKDWFYQDKIKGEYKKTLRNAVIDSSDNKMWRVHARQKFIEKKYNIKLNKSRLSQNEISNTSVKPIGDKNYICKWCNNKWLGKHVCANCNTHLYATEENNA